MNRRDVLTTAAIEWLELKSDHQLTYELVFDDKWHYIDRAGKHGYIGHWYEDKYGARLKLTYNTFKGGGFSAVFDDFAALHRGQYLTRSKRHRNLPKPKQKKDTRVADINKWHTLSKHGSSVYLKGKRVDDVNTSSIRYRGGDAWALVVGLADGKLEPRAVQKLLAKPIITKNAVINKLFSSGAGWKKGAFIVVGNFDNLTSSGAFVVEGLADALTAYKAKGRLTIAALNVDNLEPVVASLRTACPNALLDIIADNDAFRKLGNIGVETARDVAKTHNCRLIVPNFEGLDLTSKPTDINDLYQLAGLETVKQQLETARYAEPSSFEAMQGVAYERVHDFADVKLEPGVTLLKGAQGSGKTATTATLLAALSGVDPDLSLVATCHRVALTRKLVSDLAAAGVSAMTFYQDDDFDASSPRKGICSHSLFKLLKLLEQGIMPTVLLVDELQQVLRDLVQAKIDYKPAVFAALTEIVKHARYIVGLDADIAPSTVRFIQRARSGATVRVVEATHSPWHGREVRVYDDKERFLNRYSNDLNAGKNVLYGTNSKKRARKIQALAKQRGLETLALHSDSSGGEAQQDFIKDASVESMKYQVLIYSPSVGTGVSIDNDHYDVVYLDFADWLTSADCVQIALRYRRNVPMHVYIDSGSRYPETDPEKIKQAFFDAPNHDSALIRWDGSQRGILNDDYESLYLDVKVEDAHDILNFKANIVKRFVDLGMGVSFDGDKLDADFNGYLSDLEHNLHADALEQAPDVDHATANALEQQDVKSEDDSIRLERYRHRDALKLPPATMFEATDRAIRHAFEHDLLPKLSAWRTALVDDETLLERAAKNAQGHEAMFRADLYQHGALQGLTREKYRRALQAAGIDVDALFRAWQFKHTYPAASFDANNLIPHINTTYTKHSAGVQQWASWAKATPWLELPDDFDNNPIQHLNDLLRSLGLTISSKQMRRKTLNTPYLDMLVPLQNGGTMKAVRTKKGKVKRFDITYQGITGKADTRKVKRLLEHGALVQRADDTLTLDLEVLQTRFNFEGNEGRVYVYKVTGCEPLLWLFDPRGTAEGLPSKKYKDVTPPLLINREPTSDNFAFSENDTSNEPESPKAPESAEVSKAPEPAATATDDAELAAATELATVADFETAVNAYRAGLNLVPLHFKTENEVMAALPYYVDAVPMARALRERMPQVRKDAPRHASDARRQLGGGTRVTNERHEHA